MHPDLLIFLATLVFPVALALSAKHGLYRERGFRFILFGTSTICIGVLLDYLEHLELVARLLPFTQTQEFNFGLAVVLIGPGAVMTAYGIFVWMPAVSRLQAEVRRREKVEAQLRESEQRFRVMFDHAPEPITLLDAETGYYKDVNPAAEAFHGRSRDELVENLTPADLSPETQAGGQASGDVALNYLDDARSGGKPRFEWTHLDPNGEIQECEVSLVRLPAQHDRLIRACVIDVTERNRNAEALNRARRMESLAVLSGGAAHDFNNLLAVIRGATDLLNVDSERDASLLSDIRHAVTRGSELTRRLLAHARQQPISPELVDVAGALQRLATVLERTLGESIKVQTNIAEGPMVAFADAGGLDDAVLNLGLNARDAMPDGGTLALEAAAVSLGEEESSEHPDASPGNYIRISVKDNGSGIDPEHLHRIFEPFFSTKSEAKGSGLGLAAVYGFAQQSNGFVDVESEPGEGATFHLYLPVAPD